MPLSKRFWIMSVPCALLLALFALAPNPWFNRYVFHNYFSYDAQRFLEIIILVLINFYTLCLPGTARKIVSIFLTMPKMARLSLAIILFLGIFSAAQSAHPVWAFLELSLYLQLFYFCFVIAAYRAEWKISAEHVFIGLFLLCTIAYLIIFNLAFLTDPLQAHAIYTMLFPGFLNLRFFVEYQVWMLPCITLPLYFPNLKSILLKILIFFIALAWWILALLNGSTGLFFALGIAFLIVTIRWYRVILSWLKIQALLALAATGIERLFAYLCQHYTMPATIITLFMHTHAESFYAGRVHDDATIRHRLADLALQLIHSHPWLGVGPLHYSNYPNIDAAHPHNILLLLASEWGLPALLLFLGISAWGFFAWFFKKRLPTTSYEKSVIFSLSVAMLAGLAYALVEGVLVTPLSQVMFCIIFGWMFGLYAEANINTIALKKYHLVAWRVSFWLALGILLYALLILVPSLVKHEVIWIYQHYPEAVHPRFFLQGFLW